MPPAQGTKSPSPIPHRSAALKVVASVTAVLLALAWFTFPLPLHPPGSIPPGDSPPHLLIERFDSSTTNPAGRMHRRLRAEELRRMAPGAKSTLVRPHLTVFSAAGPQWHFTAGSGEVSPDGKNIYLPGRVQGRRAALEPLEIDSHDLRIMTANSYVESDEPSTVRGMAFEARGKGVKIWIEEGRIEFPSDASGVLQPR